jgi:hypothetical protein
MIDRRPALVVRCLGTADVIECVRFARENELLPSIKGGGHNIAGLAVADGALMFDMSLMRGACVDPHARTARAQGDACSATSIGKRSEHSAVGNRDARYVLTIAGAWERPEDDASDIAWAREAWNDMRRHSTGGTYINFLTEDEGTERNRGRAWQRVRTSRTYQEGMGPGQLLPGESEHQAGVTPDSQ